MEPFDLERTERILVVLPTWVGDCVMATPTLRAIRRRFSTARITFLMAPNVDGLMAGGDWMDEVEHWPARGDRNDVGANWRLARRLRGASFDLAVLLPNSFRAGMMALLSGARRRLGYARDGRSVLLTDRVATVDRGIEPHPICEHYGRIAAALGCPFPGDTLQLFTTPDCDASVERRLRFAGMDGGGPLVVISPGASFGASKLWMPERFAAVADRLVESYGASVVITFGPGEKELASSIADQMESGGEVFDDPPLSLGELKSLIRRAQLLMVTDSGPRHIAKAFGVPVVTLFGPTHQAWTDTDYADERKLSIQVDCGPCQQKVCPLGHRKCMDGITTDMVTEACGELLGSRTAAAVR
ncbi:MAG: lipopolysaccharide heptosyltransferase II [Phycisphaerales bacterium]|nr:lipopolysaccharide heptosyltransferase II [Phycisphaerales bacterium]